MAGRDRQKKLAMDRKALGVWGGTARATRNAPSRAHPLVVVRGLRACRLFGWRSARVRLGRYGLVGRGCRPGSRRGQCLAGAPRARFDSTRGASCGERSMRRLRPATNLNRRRCGRGAWAASAVVNARSEAMRIAPLIFRSRYAVPLAELGCVEDWCRVLRVTRA